MNGDTLLARITPCLENGKTGFVDCLEPGEVGVGSTEFIVMRSKAPAPATWSYFLARSPRFRSYVVQQMTGTSGRQRCSADSIRDYGISRPSPVALREFETLSTPMFDCLRHLVVENQELQATRDELLPLLLSGRVRVGDAAA